jgi:hypothetical protein
MGRDPDNGIIDWRVDCIKDHPTPEIYLHGAPHLVTIFECYNFRFQRRTLTPHRVPHTGLFLPFLASLKLIFISQGLAREEIAKIHYP